MMKRILDFILALIVFILIFPFLLIIGLLILLEDGKPILFTQDRITKNKKIFKIYKFRTMRKDTPKNVPTSEFTDANRYITRIGRILRKTSLDELPQLLNIIKGDMSIVGPRPALYNQYELIRLRDENGANSILPGLTGWAQVNGRDDISDEVKAKYDGEYVEKMNFWFDVKIILMTVCKVLKREGITA